MNVSLIKLNSIYPSFQANKKSPSRLFQIYRDYFEVQKQDKKGFETFLKKPGKGSRMEYNDIKKNHPDYIRMAREYLEGQPQTFSSVHELALVTKNIDEYIKWEYGNENHRLISIGTSPAPICQILECLGEEVIYLPISGVKNVKKDEIFDDDKSNVSILLDYLKSQGIDDKDKINLVIDLAPPNQYGQIIRGRTLAFVCDLIEDEFDLPKNKVVAFPIQHLIYRDVPRNFKTKEETTLEQARKNVFMDINFSNSAYFSNVPHFNLSKTKGLHEHLKIRSVIPDNKTNEEIFEEFENFSQKRARATTLVALDDILGND